MVKTMASEFRHRRNYNQAGHAHELTFSCYRNFDFLKAERTCRWLAEEIEDVRAKHDVLLWAYVFMPNHVHLVLFPLQKVYDMAQILRAIKQPVSRRALRYVATNASEWLPRMTQKRGNRVERHFWQSGGGYDRNVTEPRTLRAMIDYIHLNPVRRGLVERARDWRWSSAAWFEGNEGCGLIPDPVLPEWANS